MIHLEIIKSIIAVFLMMINIIVFDMLLGTIRGVFKWL
ncbi:hypothetical protein N751_16170 [Legionella pneumophila str. Leg01/11]|nr:hypothetical protein N751_16170 [Legionella pneumophila str. Leg01/11]